MRKNAYTEGGIKSSVIYGVANASQSRAKIFEIKRSDSDSSFLGGATK